MLTRHLYIKWKSRLKEDLPLGKARQWLWCWKMIWTLLFAYLQKIEWNFTNLESNHEVHLRGLMWKEPIKRWQNDVRISVWRLYSPNKKNQSKFVASNVLKSIERKGNESIRSYFIAMLCWKNYQVNRSFILLLRWMEAFATFNLTWWKKNWICCFDMKENDQSNADSLVHKIRVNFRWLNISGNKQLNKRKSRKFLTLTWSQFSSWGSEKPGMSQCSKFKINLTKTLELLIKQLSERRTLLTYAHYPTRWWWWWW